MTPRAAGSDHREPGRARGLARVAVAVAVAGAASASAGWLVTDRLERDNDFCIACHLDAETPLHVEKHRDLTALPAATLSAAHGQARVAGREDGAFRCIDCHGGTGALGRSRVKLLAAKDALWYGTGRFDEPDAMRWPLWDEDCRKCHARFEEAGAAAEERFHALAVHNRALGVACVACHLAHDPGGLPDHDFLHPVHVRAQCERCHPEFEGS
jgi:nitrate/TMAO reductase-like tetraheme cytochrome c subunit